MIVHRRAFGLVVGLLLLAGCSVAEPAPRATITPSSAGRLNEPFAAIRELTAEQTRLLHDATERSISTCMKQRGFTYQPLSYQAPAVRNADGLLGDVAYATQFGYGLTYSSGQDDDGGVSPNGAPAGMSSADLEAYTRALLGKPLKPRESGPTVIQIDRPEGTMSYRSDSCISLGTAAVRGDLKEWYTVSSQVEDMSNDVRRRVQADPAFLLADSRWSECMAAAGLGRDSRAKRIEGLLTGFSTGRRTLEQSVQDEKRTAIADATCVNSSGARATIVDLFATHEKEVGEAHEGVLTRLAELNRASADRARKTP